MRPVAPFMMMPMLDCDTGGPLQPAQPECLESASPYRNGGSEWCTTEEQDGFAARLAARQSWRALADHDAPRKRRRLLAVVIVGQRQRERTRAHFGQGQ